MQQSHGEVRRGMIVRRGSERRWNEPSLELYNSSGGLYLKRWVLVRCRWFRVFLHYIAGADPDECLHNHPWPFAFAIFLRGGYEERTIGPGSGWRRRRYWRGPGRVEMPTSAFRAVWHWLVGCRINRLAPDGYHKIERVLPGTWTLFCAGPIRRDWGFLESGIKGMRHVPWRAYLGLPADTKLED